MKKSFLPISKLDSESFSSILGYPRSTKKQRDARIKELKKLSIKGVFLEGSSQLNGVNVLGKGYVGIVVLALKGEKKVALKIRRTDSPRKGMTGEAKFLSLANKVKVGPKLIDSSRNFLIMEFIDGMKIGKFVDSITKKDSTKIKSIIRKVLEDCYSLDLIGLDHGELSSISKHVIIGKKIILIDFESASKQRRVSNVTSATQGILIGSGISKKIRQIIKIPSKKKIIIPLRNYKQNKTRENFNQILKILEI